MSTLFDMDANPPDGSVQIDHNLLDGSGVDYDGTTAGEHSVSGDPAFEDPTASDYHLTAESPAVDQGSPDLAPALDYDGVARPSGAGVDIGAFEL